MGIGLCDVHIFLHDVASYFSKDGKMRDLKKKLVDFSYYFEEGTVIAADSCRVNVNVSRELFWYCFGSTSSTAKLNVPRRSVSCAFALKKHIALGDPEKDVVPWGPL